MLKALRNEGTMTKLTESALNFPLISSSAATLALATRNVKIWGPKVQTLMQSGPSPEHFERILAMANLEGEVSLNWLTTQSLTGDQRNDCAPKEDAVDVWYLESMRFWNEAPGDLLHA
jgi:hypothetical protein